jgi:hypothetical protein
VAWAVSPAMALPVEDSVPLMIVGAGTLCPHAPAAKPVALVLGIMGTFAVFGISYGPMASFIPEQFHTRYRYTASGLAFNLGGIIGGAIPPLIAGSLLTAYGSWAIGLMLAILALISLGSTIALRETRGANIEN